MAQSQNLPELFTVKDVDSTDKLNIRLAPSASAEVIGTFEPGQSGIEVVAQSTDGTWSKVNSGEASGWVASKFLEVQPNTWVNGKLPSNLTCYGTEPFWSLSAKEGALTYRPMDGEEKTLSEIQIMDRNFEGDRNRFILARSGNEQVTAVIQPGQCSDGMSDRSFGLTSVLIFQGGDDGAKINHGCCSIAK